MHNCRQRCNGDIELLEIEVVEVVHWLYSWMARGVAQRERHVAAVVNIQLFRTTARIGFGILGRCAKYTAGEQIGRAHV